MAADAGRQDRLTARGIRSIEPHDALQAMAAVLRATPGEVCVADLDVPRLSSFVPASGGGLFAELLPRGDTAATTSAPADPCGPGGMRQVAPAERPAWMLQQVRQLAARVIGVSDAARIETARPLQEQGFDSLMAVDLRNLLARTFDTELPVSLLFDYPTAEKISRFLLETALVWDEQEASGAGPATLAAEKSADELVADIEQLLAD